MFDLTCKKEQVFKDFSYSRWEKKKGKIKSGLCMYIRSLLVFQDMSIVLKETIQRWIKS